MSDDRDHVTSPCDVYVDRQFVAAEGLDELGREMTRLSLEGYDVNEEEGERPDIPGAEAKYVVNAQKTLCRCVCQACGHRNGDKVRAKRSSK